MYKNISIDLTPDRFILNSYLSKFISNKDSSLDRAFMRLLNDDGIAIFDNVLIPESDYDLVFYLICFGSIPVKLFYLELLYQFYGICTDDSFNHYSSTSFRESESVIHLNDCSNDIKKSFISPNLSTEDITYDGESNIQDVDGFGLPSDYFAFE